MPQQLFTCNRAINHHHILLITLVRSQACPFVQPPTQQRRHSNRYHSQFSEDVNQRLLDLLSVADSRTLRRALRRLRQHH
jgi:hypothetical protein